MIDMPTGEMIQLQQFCIHHHIQQQFVYALQDAGLIEIIEEEDDLFIPSDHLEELEKMVRLHTDMDINIEGIEAITHLLQRMHQMQLQIVQLSNKLSSYEK
jgi:hypothetical protein